MLLILSFYLFNVWEAGEPIKLGNYSEYLSTVLLVWSLSLFLGPFCFTARFTPSKLGRWLQTCPGPKSPGNTTLPFM